MLKYPPTFLKKMDKNQFLASWRGLMVFMYKNKVFYFSILNIFVFLHLKAKTSLKAPFVTFAKIFAKISQKWPLEWI